MVPDGGGGRSALAVQMNDVSILFPLGGPLDLTSYLAASDHGLRGSLLPEAVYDDAGPISGSSGSAPPGGTRTARYADLRVVSVRIDPCFAALQPDPTGNGCKNQLRLVAQELTPVDGGLFAFDSAVHLFYDLTRDEVLDLVQEIAALRVRSSGDGKLGPLAPHPILVAEGLAGPMAVGVRELILRYAGQRNLSRVAEFSATNTGANWTFKTFDVVGVDPPTLTPMVIPTLPAATTTQTFFAGFNTDLGGVFTPATTGTDDFTALADVGRATALDPADRASAFGALVRTDNPHLVSPDTTDCASCHLATPVSVLVAVDKFGLRESEHPQAFVADPRFVQPSELVPTFPRGADSGASRLNVHAFSYSGRAPGINQRTVNETAAVVAYLNGMLP